MFDPKKIVILLLVTLVVSLPFVFQEKANTVVPIGDAETLTIMTPHNETLRREYAIGFKKWYRVKTGKEVNIDWRYQGGGRDATRYIETMYANNFRLHWVNELHRTWDSSVIAAFASRSEKKLQSSEHGLEVEVTREFFKSNVGCGIDILFGGGVYEFEAQSSKGNLIPSGLLVEHPEMFSEDTIPEFLSGNRLWDEHGRWFGGSLTGFGIIYNSEAILAEGIPFFPMAWMDIGRPEFFKKVAIVDPTRSSSTQKALMMLIQQQMRICYDDLKHRLNVDELSKEDEEKIIGEGWINGLRLIQKIVANGRYFTESTTRPVIDVSAGNCLVGITVDFYGFAESKHLEERSGSNRFKFVMPYAGGAPSPDPIGVFRGAEHPELAKDFIEFILSLDGQKLLDFNLHTPGGPTKATMRRTPILKTIYNAQYDQYRCSPDINPYKFASLFVSHEEWTSKLSVIMGPLVKLAFIDTHDELSAAMRSIIRAQKDGRMEDAEKAYQVMAALEDLSCDNIYLNIIPVFDGKNILKIASLQNKITKKFRKQYLKAKEIADGRP
ncbi:MAG: ABC transporter substrate-binding protein [Puniceicoccales bacterium]|jgi:ABC-type Fe3+ transport system substrate-binding protein|nr:ABC transporter substrate-binding protein [Puniceicoccales bacterium]